MDGYNAESTRRQMVHKLPGCNVAWTETHWSLEALVAAGELFPTWWAMNLGLRGQEAALKFL